MEIPFGKHQEEEIIEAVGPVIPAILRESVTEGFYRFKTSRALDPVGFAEYSLCAKMNMLYDRIALASRELLTLASSDMPGLWWQVGRNKRATEIFFDPYFAFRIKRTKGNRNDLSTSVDTGRQLTIKAEFVPPVSQSLFDFMGENFPPENRIWITIPYDLDELEENVTQVSIGIELRTKFLWKQPLPEAPADILASFPTAVADRVNDMRASRSA
jgi:hypothetical protein